MDDQMNVAAARKLTRDEMMNDPRHLLAWRVQSVMAEFIPDDYEENWPSKASFKIADRIMDGWLSPDIAPSTPPQAAISHLATLAPCEAG